LKAKSQFEQLIEGLSEKNAVSSVTEAWIARNAGDHMGAAVILRLFTHELIEGAAAETVPVPEMAICAAVADATAQYEIEPIEFKAISMSSTTNWDTYVRSLFETIPDEVPLTALATYLWPNVKIHRAKALWSGIRERLTPDQQRDLLSWYSAMARTRTPSEPIPSFVRQVVE